MDGSASWTGDDRRAPDLDRALGANIRALMAAAGKGLGVDLSMEATTAVLARQAKAMLSGVDCFIAVVAQERQESFRVLGAAGSWAEAQLGREWVVTGTAVGRAMRENRTIDSHDISALTPLAEALRDGGMQRARIYPISTGKPLPDGRTVLGLFAITRRDDRGFTDFERQLLDDFVQLAGMTFNRAELKEAANQTATRLKIGVDLAVDLASSLHPPQVVRRLLVRAVAAVRADRATLFSIAGDGVIVDDSYDLLDRPPTPGETADLTLLPYVEQAIARRAPVCEAGLSSSNTPLQGAARHRCTMPLVFGGEVTAVLVVSRRFDPAFNPADVSTLHLIGSVAVMAIRNARLYAAAEDALKARDDLLIAVAHELRTPLTITTGYLDLINDGSLGAIPEPLLDPLAEVTAKNAELRRLVEDLLNASSLGSGSQQRFPAISDREATDSRLSA